MSPKASVIEQVSKNAQTYNEITIASVGIGTSIATVLSKMGGTKGILSFVSINIATIVAAANALVLFLAFIYIKKSKMKADHEEIQSLQKILNLPSNIINEKIERVNLTISQLVDALKWFMILLIFYYILQIVTYSYQQNVASKYKADLKELNGYKITDSTSSNFKNLMVINDSVKMEQLKNGKNKVIDTNINRIIDQSITSNQKKSKNVADVLGGTYNFKNETITGFFITLFGSLMNILSSAFILVCFLVLYSKTLDEQNRTILNYRNIPFLSAMVVIFIYLIVLILGNLTQNLYVAFAYLELMSGLYASIAMFLLFSRFISMEYYFKKDKSSWRKRIYYYGIILVLPVYVGVQPTIAFFHLDFLVNTNTFKNSIYLICMWGKVFFLLFIYNSLKAQWIHAYVLSLYAGDDTIPKISMAMKSVEDFRTTN